MRPQGGTGAAGRALPLAVVLAVLVIAAAGLVGTAHFTGPRWYPHIGGTSTPAVRTTPIMRKQPGSGRLPLRKARPASTSWVLVVVIAVVLLVLANFLWRWLRGRRLAAPSPDLRLATAVAPQVTQPEPEPEPEKLVSGIALALQVLDDEYEPADAVVRAWLGLQQTAEESGIARRASETPTEFASRVLTRSFADPESLRTLLRLYLRTRFGDHPVTAEEVSAVRAALQRLLDGWQRANGETGSTVRAR